jgi:hypothetical protein
MYIKWYGDANFVFFCEIIKFIAFFLYYLAVLFLLLTFTPRLGKEIAICILHLPVGSWLLAIGTLNNKL